MQTQMQIGVWRRLIVILGAAALACGNSSSLATDEQKVKVEAEAEDATIEVTSPSPDGRYAFRSKWSPDAQSLELIGKKSGKVLVVAAESQEGGSQRVALMVSTWRRSAEIAIFERKGETFTEVEVVDLPLAEIPEKYQKDKRLWHVVESNWATPVRWLKNGNLVVTVTTTIDGNDNFVTAERTATLAIKDGKATVTSSKLAIKKRLE
jgi:hypothetical protein